MIDKTESVGTVKQEYFTFAEGPDELKLDSGQSLGPITLSYETYGELNTDKSH